MTTGRGAWTTIGMDKTRYYELTRPRVGSHVLKELSLDPEANNYRAANYGVKTIQAILNYLGYANLTVSGKYGWATKRAVRRAQKNIGLTVDGICGPSTFRALLRKIVPIYAVRRNIDPALVWGVAGFESLHDPGAVGYNTPADKGLAQFNTSSGNNTTWWNKVEVTYGVEEAFDYDWALNELVNRLAWARAEFAGKSQALRRDCMILQHNSPVNAYRLFKGETVPQQAKDYIADVKAAMETW